jgi:hypothetical protein
VRDIWGLICGSSLSSLPYLQPFGVFMSVSSWAWSSVRLYFLKGLSPQYISPISSNFRRI